MTRNYITEREAQLRVAESKRLPALRLAGE
jgi:hypothetical protein